MLNSLLLIHDLVIGQQHQCLSRSLSLSVGLFIQGEAIDVAQSAPQGAHYHADVIYLLGIKKRVRALWSSELNVHQFGSRPTIFLTRWTTHPCILYHVCATRVQSHCYRVRQVEPCQQFGEEARRSY